MKLWQKIFGGGNAAPSAPERASQPMMASRGDAGVLIQTSDELERYLTGKAPNGKASTGDVNRAMQLTAVQACVRLIGGGVSNTPRKVIRQIEQSVQNEVVGGELWNLVSRRPNRWQRPAQFFRMGTAHVMLRGNFYCRKVKGGNGKVAELIPLDPDRVMVEQKPNRDVIYRYSRKSDGKIIEYKQDDVLHLYLLTLDGVTGVTPITFARSTMDGGLAMEEYGKSIFENGARVAGVFSTEKRLGVEGRQNISDSFKEYRSGGAREGTELILEDGLKYERMAMTAQDAQYMEAREMTKADIYELYGIPRHMTALAQTQSNWGTGVEAHNKQFMQWVLEDYYVMWEEGLNVDVVAKGSDLRVAFDRSKLVRGDLEARSNFYSTMMQWGAMSPNEVRSEFEMNPRAGGDIFYPPPNMTQDDDPDDDASGDGNSQQQQQEQETDQ